MARPLLAGSPMVSGAIIAAAFVAVGVLRGPLPLVMLVLAPLSVLAARWRAR